MKTKVLIVGIGLLVGILSVGITGYNEHIVLGIAVEILICIGSFLGASITCLFIKNRPFQVVLWIYLGFMVSALARIIFDIAFGDPTSHNLLPFELVYYTIFSLPSSFVGAYLVHFSSRVKIK